MATHKLRAAMAAAGIATLTGAALISTASEAFAGKPTGGGGTTTFTGSSYSGRAQVLTASLTPLDALGRPLGTVTADLSDTQELPSTGGFQHTALLALQDPGISGLQVSGEVAGAMTAGSGNEAHSFATVAQLNLSLGGVLTVSASVLPANSDASCDTATGAYSTSGSSAIAAISINGKTYAVGTAPNQKIVLPDLATIVLNEQTSSPGSITVNAVHIMLGGALSPLLDADVVISHAHSDITCTGTTTPPPCQVSDFVTGGGWIYGDQGQRVTFAVMGGQKPNGLSGHLNVVDHGSSGTHLSTGNVVNYTVDSPTQRTVYYDTATAIVQDNGEPGSSDTFSVASGSYAQSGVLQGGNIQIHHPRGCGSSSSGGGKKH